MSEVLVVANASDPDAGYIGERLEQRGFALRTVFRDRGGTPAGVEAAGRPALVLLLGSEWAVHRPVDVAARDTEAALVRSAVAAGVPVLGLCYGAQLAAYALGGRVRTAERPEAGLVEVDTSDPDLVPAGPWTAFHTDVFDPPPEASVLARNACGVQAFALDGVLAVQFHPEVRPDVLAGWADRFPDLLVGAGVDATDLVALARGSEARSREAAHRLVDAFLARGRPAVAAATR